MPDSVLMPAPVKQTTRLAARIISVNSAMGVGTCGTGIDSNALDLNIIPTHGLSNGLSELR
jgi:hypothetical protein